VIDYQDAGHAASEFLADDDEPPSRWGVQSEMADALAELLVLLFAGVALASFVAVVWS